MDGTVTCPLTGFNFDGSSSAREMLRLLHHNKFKRSEDIVYPDGVKRTIPQRDVFLYDAGFGLGVKAGQDINPNTRIVIYAGEVINEAEASRRTEYHQGQYFLTLDDEFTIDAKLVGSYGRFINHSCKPNTRYTGGELNGRRIATVVAIKKILAGQVITCSYVTPDTPIRDRYPITYIGEECLCGESSHLKFGPELPEKVHHSEAQPRKGGKFSKSPRKAAKFV